MRTKPLPVHRSIHTHLTALFPGLRLPMWAVTRKVRPYLDFTEARDSEWQWHQLRQLGHIIGKCALRSRQITTPATLHSVFYRPDALPAAQPTASKHWRHRSYSTYRKFSCFSSHHSFDTHIYTVYVNSSAASTRSRDRPGQTLSNLFNIPPESCQQSNSGGWSCRAVETREARSKPCFVQTPLRVAVSSRCGRMNLVWRPWR